MTSRSHAHTILIKTLLQEPTGNSLNTRIVTGTPVTLYQLVTVQVNVLRYSKVAEDRFRRQPLIAAFCCNELCHNKNCTIESTPLATICYCAWYSHIT